MNAKDLRHISKKRESLSNGVEKKNNGVLNAISSLSKRIFPPEVLKVIQSMEFILLNIWLFWLLAGTLYYSNLLNVGWFKGFYMAINVGYSIGWGDIPEDLHSQMFSSFFLMVGSSFVAAALGYFANFVILDADNWYVNEIQREAYLNYLAENEDNRVLKALAFMQYNFEKVRAVALWFAFVFFGTFFAAMLNADHWNVVNAFYFAISSLSTGGLYSLPPNSPDWYYFLTGLYCAFGVPLMGIAMGSVASLFIKTGGVHETMEQLREVITPDEIQMLEDFGKLIFLEFVVSI